MTMALNTKCPFHGNAHTDYLCTLKKQSEEITEILAIPDKVARVRAILALVIGEENVDQWLNSPHPDLGNRTPQSVINEGLVGAVVTILENALSGIPS